MNAVFRFRNFKVYKDARLLRLEIRSVTCLWPAEEKFLLIAQLNRAIDSILLNIAEGSERYSDKDFSRFLNNAVASVCEVVACFDVACDSNYITEERRSFFVQRLEGIYRQLRAFTAKVRRDS